MWPFAGAGVFGGEVVMGIRVWVAVVSVPVLFGLGGCGDDGGGSGVASAGGAEVSASRSVSPEDAQLKFAQCMRDNGVDVPDPGSEGAKSRRLGEGVEPKKLEAALEKCQSWLQAGGRFPDLKDPEVRDQYVEFAQCMREHGVNIPDPGPNGEFRLPEGDIDRNALEKAREKCGDKLPGGGK